MDQGSRDRQARIEREQAKAQAMAEEQARKLKQQQDALAAQKLAEQQAMSAKQRQSANLQSGVSGLINLNPESKSSILG